MAKDNKKYKVELTSEERRHLVELVSINKANRSKIVAAYMLLKSDEGEGGEGWIDQRIASAYNVSVKKVERTRQRFVEEGFDSALKRKPASNYKPRKLQGDEEAFLIATCCSKPPEGRARWTLKLLAGKLVEMEYVESISPETVRQTLKKTLFRLGKKSNGVFRLKPPPSLSAKWKRS